MNLMIRHIRRLVILVVGITVLLIGIAMIVLPGPAVVVIPLGLSILAAEFAWAKRWLDRVKDIAAKKTGVGTAKRTDPGKIDGPPASPLDDRRAS